MANAKTKVTEKVTKTTEKVEKNIKVIPKTKILLDGRILEEGKTYELNEENLKRVSHLVQKK